MGNVLISDPGSQKILWIVEDLTNNTNTEFTQANKVPGSKLKEKGTALMFTYNTFFAKYCGNLMKLQSDR